MLGLYSLFTNLVNGVDSPVSRLVTSETWPYILLIYLISSGCYLFLAVPASILIERYQRKLKWLSYAIAGVVAGYLFLSVTASLNQSPANLAIEATLFYAGAGLLYYGTLVSLRSLFNKKTAHR
ncbi:MFS family permease [Alkalihalobacillus xiaoxiensis]|uniref:MFS family permease n=1 Tax=Shouchella xiaoxiensis TaxID=766895 RepID=A0ABS2SSP5_9BACI|nr:hypothetical protein [Shouchella xiaoxiensis]MBM7837825.1 MFS family permease [Shouchella xiaoxiensis]